jgi:RNA polymerase sigma-70 factor (ECF subfamily)
MSESNQSHSNQSKSDEDLVAEIRLGFKSSFSELVKRHQKGLMRMSLRFVKDMDIAQDVVQEALLSPMRS